MSCLVLSFDKGEKEKEEKIKAKQTGCSVDYTLSLSLYQVHTGLLGTVSYFKDRYSALNTQYSILYTPSFFQEKKHNNNHKEKSVQVLYHTQHIIQTCTLLYLYNFICISTLCISIIIYSYL